MHIIILLRVNQALFSLCSTNDVPPQTYEEVADIAECDKKDCPVYEEIIPRDQTAIDQTRESNNLFTKEYAEIATMNLQEAKMADEYELTQCIAYGLPIKK